MCTWAVLTNFESVRIYNAEWKTNDIFQNHLKTINCFEFIERYQELSLLAKDSFQKGILDEQAEKWGKKTKRRRVDKQLLLDFTNFRKLLSKDIKNNNNKNRNITDDELEECIQRILDRLIFVRSCEDREIEEKKLVSTLRDWENRGKGQLIRKIRDEVFMYFDNHYDSRIFENHLCDSLDIGNIVLQKMIEGLYDTSIQEVKYDFSVIEADILGDIYEQYLRPIIIRRQVRAGLTKLPKRQAYRKSQGIYYTPRYIVEYITRNTLDKVLDDKKTDPTKIRLLDMACGSGSFLIKAFDTLHNHYRIHDSDRDFSQTKLDPLVETGTYTKRIQIIDDNIYGVDLDNKQ